MFEEAIQWYCDENGLDRGNLDFYVVKTPREAIELSRGWHYIAEEAVISHYSRPHPPFATFSACVGDIEIKPFIILGTWGYDTWESLFHELTHFRQNQKGQLRTVFESGRYGGGFFRLFWKGEEFRPETPYHKMPWEIEAFKEQKIWSRKWHIQKNKQNTSRENTFKTAREPLWTDSQRSLEFLPGPSLENWYRSEYIKHQ